MKNRLRSRLLKIKNWEPHTDLSHGEINILTGVGFIIMGVIMQGFPGIFPILLGMVMVTLGAYLEGI